MVNQHHIEHDPVHSGKGQGNIHTVDPQPFASKKEWSLSPYIWSLILLGSGIIGLESLGVTNIIPSFGVGGRPIVTLGLWHFTDVPNDFWARPFISGLIQKRVISGYANDAFRPNQAITRAEFAAMLDAAFDEEMLQQNIDFEDVSSEFWGASAITNTAKRGFFEGYPQDRFRPNQSLSRANALVALANGLDLTTAKLTEKTTDQVLSIYKDSDQIPKYARDATAAATAAGLLVRESPTTQLNPNQPMTRAEAASLVYQTLVYLGDAEAIASPYFVNYF